MAWSVLPFPASRASLTDPEEPMPHILIVEDESATAWALEQGLSDEGYSIATVDSAEKALVAERARRADLVITDLRLPRMDGLELVRRLKGRKHAVPVIVVTAYGSPGTLRDLEEAGIHACFPKPFRMEQLRKSVKSALDPEPNGGGTGEGER
jgi:DNA-binding NtrC family response regulator